MQLVKKLWAKVFAAICMVGCIFALAFGFTACVGDTGPQGETGPQGSQGEAGAPGADGEDGEDGEDGLTPEIGENGNWWIGDTDTGIPATGADGADGEDGEDGDDGLTPHIGENGNWWIGETDTGVAATGEDGKGIKDVKYENGKLVIIYTDDSTQEIEITLPEAPACDHDLTNADDWYKYTVEEGTCVSVELQLWVCDIDGGCGYAFIHRGELDPDNHVHLDEEVTAPTCTEEGYTTAVCEDCGTKLDKYDIVSALGHKYEAEYTKATCEKDAYITYTCSVCDDSYVVTATEIAADTTGKYDEVLEAAGVTEDKLYATGHSGIEKAVTIEVVEEGENRCEDGYQELLVCSYCYDYVYESRNVPATGHHVTADWKVTTQPTLTTAGVLSGYCDKCGNNEEVVLPVISEANGYTKTDSTAPSCTVSGTDTYSYTVGEWTGTFTITTTAAHQYNGQQVFYYPDNLSKPIYTKTEIEEMGLTLSVNIVGDCTTVGFATFTCTECVGNVVIPYMGDHVKGEVVEHKDATCTSAGYTEYLCAVCGKPFTEDIAKLEHDFNTAPSEQVNLDGTITLTFKCANGCVETNVITINQEAYSTEVTKQPTCFEEGVMTYKYTYNEQDYSFTVSIAKLNHSYKGHEFEGLFDEEGNQLYYVEEGLVEPSVNIPGSCDPDDEQYGWGSFICEHCEQNVVVQTIKNHEYVKGETVAPTCTEKGYTIYTCEVCGTEKKDDFVEPIPHNYESTLTGSEGNYVLTLKCSMCGDTITYNATNVEFIGTTADCNQEGQDIWSVTYNDEKLGEQTITVYGNKYDKNVNLHTTANGTHFDSSKIYTYDEIKALIDYGQIEVSVNIPGDGGCKDTGYASFDCSDCGGNVIVIFTGEHLYETKTQPATCTEAGWTAQVCSVCGAEEAGSRDEIPATGHTYQFAVVEPTLEAAGKVTVTCADCGYEEVITLPALNANDYSYVKGEEATCFGNGKPDTYTITIKYGKDVHTGTQYSKEYTFTVANLSTGEHHFVKEYEWFYDGLYYTGDYCDQCKKVYVTGTSDESIFEEYKVTVSSTAELQAALDACRENMTITLTAGTYEVSSFDIGMSTVRIIGGEGVKMVASSNASADTGCIVVTGAQNARLIISGITFEGIGGVSRAICVTEAGNKGVTLEVSDCMFDNFLTGIYLGGIVDAKITDCSFSNCTAAIGGTENLTVKLLVDTCTFAETVSETIGWAGEGQLVITNCPTCESFNDYTSGAAVEVEVVGGEYDSEAVAGGDEAEAA